MCIKNQDVDRMLKGIRQIENDDMAAMETHQLAEVMAIFKALSDDYEKIEKVLRAELMSRMDNEIVLTFPDLNRKVQLKEGRATTTINAADVMLVMNNYGIGNQFPDIVNVIKAKVERIPEENNAETISDIVKQFSTTEIGQPYIAVTKMVKGDY